MANLLLDRTPSDLAGTWTDQDRTQAKVKLWTAPPQTETGVHAFLQAHSHRELFSSLEGPGTLRAPEKWGNITNFPSPVRPPKTGKIAPKKGSSLRKYNSCTFSAIFPHFRGSDRGGEFCNFSPGPEASQASEYSTRNTCGNPKHWTPPY